MVQRTYVRLHRTTGHWPNREVNTINAAGDAGHVAGHRGAGSIMRMLPERHLGRHDLLQANCCFIDRHRICRATRVLQADTVDLDIALEQLAPDVNVELSSVDLVRFERQAHQRDTDLMVHASCHNRLTCLDQVRNIVHVVEVAIPGGAVDLHELGLKIQSFHGLGRQGHARNRTSENLKIHVRPDGRADLPHVFKRIFTEVEVGSLIAGSSAEFEVPDAGFS